MTHTPHTERRWMSIGEAATYVGMSTKTLRRRIDDGTLTAYRAGPREIRIDRTDLDALFTPVEPGSPLR